MDYLTRLSRLLEESPFRVFFFVGSLLLAFSAFLHIAGFTFLPVDQLYCRDYLPWNTIDFSTPCSIFRAGDDILENDVSARELSYLRNNPYQQSYSERIMNGAPVAYAYGSTPYVPFKLLTRVLSHPSSANVAGLFYLFASFVVAYAIGRLLGMAPPYSLILGALSLPPMAMGLIDAGNLSLLSYGLIALGMLLFYKKDRVGAFVILIFLGSVALLIGAMYQHYVYAILGLLLAGLFYLDAQKKEKFLVMLAATGFILLGTAMIFNFTLERHFLTLTESQKFDTSVTFTEMLKMKGYAIDPLAWTGYHLPLLHRQIFAIIGGETGSSLHAAIGSGIFSPGPLYLVLVFMGLALLLRKSWGYVFFTLFWFLYAVGIVSLLLSILVGDPFRSESSLRASNLFFLFGNVAAVTALITLIKNPFTLSVKGKVIAILFLGYVFIASIGFLGGNYFLLDSTYPFAETLYIGISAALGIGALLFLSSHEQWKKRVAYGSLIISLLLVPMGRLFLGAPPFTFALHSQAYYIPLTDFEKELKKQKSVTRIAMVQDGKEGLLHEVTPLWFEVPTVNAYFNPILKEYAELFHFHRFLFENPSFTIDEFRDFTRTNNAITNNLSAWHSSDAKITLTPPTRRFLELTQTNALITPESASLENPEWERKVKANGLSLWITTQAPVSYRFTTETSVIPDKWKRLSYVLTNEEWNPLGKTVIAENLELRGNASPQLAALTLEKEKDGYRLFSADVPQEGILSLPVTYSSQWKAMFHTKEGTKMLETLRANYAFLGVAVPAGKGTIEILYDDSPLLRHWIVSVTGLILLLAILFFLKRNPRIPWLAVFIPFLTHPIKAVSDVFSRRSSSTVLSQDGLQFARYVMVGVSNVLLDFVIYLSLTRGWEFWRFHYLWANSLSFIVVVTWSFFWNKHWTFQERSQKHHTQYLKFLTITVAGLGIYQTILYIGIEKLFLYDVAAKLLAIPLMTLWNFIMHRMWTFRVQSPSALNERRSECTR